MRGGLGWGRGVEDEVVDPGLEIRGVGVGGGSFDGWRVVGQQVPELVGLVFAVGLDVVFDVPGLVGVDVDGCPFDGWGVVG